VSCTHAAAGQAVADGLDTRFARSGNVDAHSTDLARRAGLVLLTQRLWPACQASVLAEGEALRAAATGNECVSLRTDRRRSRSLPFACQHLSAVKGTEL